MPPRTASPPPFPYQNPYDPHLHNGIVEVTGSKEVNLGIGHNGFTVDVSAEGSLEDLEVEWAKVTDTRGRATGRFTITVYEAPQRIAQAGLVKAPTTPSTQATGAGNTLWNVDLPEYLAKLAGTAAEGLAAADFAIVNSAVIAGFDSGDSVVAAIVLKNSSGTVSIDKVVGTPAVTGNQVAPTDATIQAALGAGVKWVRLADCTLNRTGDTTVTQSQNNKVRWTRKQSQNAVNVRFSAVTTAGGGI